MKRGFTLVELLVVIAIIAILSTLSVVALNSARAKSRDARRQSDIKQIRTALDMYYDSNNQQYPAGNDAQLGKTDYACLTSAGWATSGCTSNVLMQKVPTDPLTGRNYTYSVGTNNSDYTIQYNLESTTTTSTATSNTNG